MGVYSQEKTLNIELLEQLKYTGCAIKEALRINPPVPGGFRVALKTFEIDVSLNQQAYPQFRKITFLYSKFWQDARAMISVVWTFCHLQPTLYHVKPPSYGNNWYPHTIRFDNFTFSSTHVCL